MLEKLLLKVYKKISRYNIGNLLCVDRASVRRVLLLISLYKYFIE